MITHQQLQELTRYINDRFAYVAAQMQSVDYQPPVDLLERWQRMGLVSPDVTPATFLSTLPAEAHLIRNAFIMGRLIEAVEAGGTYDEMMRLAATMPLLKPDLAAIAVAEQQTALYITDNAADLATKVGQASIKLRNETIKQMAIDYHSQTLQATVLDREKKIEAGLPLPEKQVASWREFASELHHKLDDKARDLERVAYFEITDAQKQGQAHELMADGNVDKLVYKRPMPTACAQCKHLYLEEDGVTPRVFKLSDMVACGNNVGRKPHPIKGGKVVPGGRPDGQETLQAVVGLLHPWCQCLGVYEFTGKEPWAKKQLQG